jgi:hypothetical protein
MSGSIDVSSKHFTVNLVILVAATCHNWPYSNQAQAITSYTHWNDKAAGAMYTCWEHAKQWQAASFYISINTCAKSVHSVELVLCHAVEVKALTSKSIPINDSFEYMYKIVCDKLRCRVLHIRGNQRNAV